MNLYRYLIDTLGIFIPLSFLAGLLGIGDTGRVVLKQGSTCCFFEHTANTSTLGQPALSSHLLPWFFPASSALVKGQGSSLSLLYNPGPSYVAGKTIVNDIRKPAHQAPWVSRGSTLAQAQLVGDAARMCPQGLKGSNVDGVANLAASNGACESYYTDTRFGWSAADMGRWPGWDVFISGTGGGETLEFHYANHAYPITTCKSKSREVGLSYDGVTSLRRDMRLSKFKAVRGIFQLKVSAQKANPLMHCPKGYEAPFDNITNDPWAYLSADFRVNYFRNGRNWVRGDILSVHVYNVRPVSQKKVFWQGPNCHVNRSNNQYGCVIMLNTSAVETGLPTLQVGEDYQTFQIDFKALYKKYIYPPPGLSIDDAVVTGFDVYSSMRGTDINFSVKGVNLIGEFATGL